MRQQQSLHLRAAETGSTNAYIEAQTVESTIRAYGAGEIELPEVPKDTPKTHVRYVHKSVCEGPYTTATLAKFLGWQTFDEAYPEGRPNHACNVAFQMLDAFELGIVSRKELRGVKRDVIGKASGRAGRHRKRKTEK